MQKISRRIEFLLNEARSDHPWRDQTVTYAMRVISNYCAIGRDAGSSHIKKYNQRISKEALKLKNEIPFDEWIRETINEHQEPLKVIWDWLLDEKDSLTVQLVLDRFRKYPMVIITKDENSTLNRLGLSSNGDPEERYRQAGIEIVQEAQI